MEVELEDKPCSYYKDQLTGLDNRFAMLEYLKLSSRLNIFVVNIDNFSTINNAYGYQVGDEVLLEISKLLDDLRLKNARLFRFDGDEFVFIIKDFFNFRELQEFAESILSFFNHIDIDLGHNDIVVKVSASIGIAMGSGITTLNHAKVAINELRLHSRNSFKLFSAKSEYARKQQESVFWISKIRHAIEDEKLVSFFQPIYNISTGKVEKFECLARIEDEQMVVSPMRFMEAARVSGSLSLVTRTIILNAFKEFSNNDYEFSLNITGSDIHLGYLESFLMKQSEKYNVHPSRVVLELLEDIVTLTESNMLDQISSLRRLGFKIAIDDFGQENSNFSRLLDLNPDYLKIDGAFIKNIIEDKQSQIIVEAIVDVCQKSGIRVIAEYIHNEDVLERVEEMGIDYGQGYFIGEPLKDISTYLEE